MAKWYKDSGFQSYIVLSTRVRLARNLRSVPFPGKMSDSQAQSVIDTVENALSTVNMGFKRTDILATSPTEREKLVEERLISPNLARRRMPAAVFVSEAESLSVMVNEEDHIRMQAIFAGFECQKAYELVSGLDSYMAKSLDYAVHSKYGYLTSCLTNVGTGIRISVMMHLPAICKAKLADSLFSAMGKLGVTLRGMYGEGSKASGYLFQISNQMTLGLDEKEIADRLNDVVNQLISKERELRREIAKNEGMTLEDKVMRSLGVLATARLLSTKEMLTLFSNVRMGISLGYINNVASETLNTLMVETGAAHLAEETESVADRDARRASIVRETINL